MQPSQGNNNDVSNNQDIENNIFFEGGSEDNSSSSPHNDVNEIDLWYDYEQDETFNAKFEIQFEGGSDEDGLGQTLGDEGAASTIRSKRSKKKKKKRAGSNSGR